MTVQCLSKPLPLPFDAVFGFRNRITVGSIGQPLRLSHKARHVPELIGIRRALVKEAEDHCIGVVRSSLLLIPIRK